MAQTASLSDMLFR